MKKAIFTFLILLTIVYSNAQNFDWAKSMGGTINVNGQSIVLDASGNIYTTGQFSGTVDFDPHPTNTFILTSSGGDDVFISKLDANGNFVWAKRLGGTSEDIGYSIAVDDSGNVYTTGHFNGTADFDPHPTNTFNMTSAGSDIFVSKLDANGNFVWARHLGGAGYDVGRSIVVDASGNVYTTGLFNVTADFDPHPINTYNMASAGSLDIFISKLDANGNFIWAKQLGGTGDDRGYSIAVDVSGNVYTTGEFRVTSDFDPHPTNTFNLTSAGGSDIFISKLDNSGNFVWAKSMGGTGYDIGNSITVDYLGNVYTTGEFRVTSDFDPHPTNTFNLTSAGGTDVFVSKLDTGGNFEWTKQFGGTAFDYGNSITVDFSGNVYTTGHFANTADFDPDSINTFNMTSAGSVDIFMSKLDPSGSYVWAKQIGGINADIGYSIVVDASGNVFTTGYFQDTVDFDPHPINKFYLSSGGSFNSDVFVLKLVCTPTTSTDLQSACDSFTWIDSVTYYTSNNTATFTIPNSAGCDSVVTLNLTINYSTTSTDIHTACDSFTWIDNVTYYTSNNTATFTLPNSAGCDSVVTLNLTIINPTTGTDTQTACDSFTWIDSVTYYASNNTATFTLPNSAGCDSVVTLNLTINYSTTSTDIHTACDSFTWIDNVTYYTSNNTATFTLPNSAGCDSVVTLNLTINNPTTGTDTQTACDSFTWIDNVTYYANTSTATFILPNSVGCDSVVTLNLTITILDLNLTLNNDTLISNEVNGSYQWVDCNNNHAPVFGETNRIFAPTVGGNYAVILKNGICTDTSECRNVLSVLSIKSNFAIRVYPNPSQGVVHLEGEVAFSYSLYDIQGRFLVQGNSQDNKGVIENLTSGLYFIRLQTGGNIKTIKVMVE